MKIIICKLYPFLEFAAMFFQDIFWQNMPSSKKRLKNKIFYCNRYRCLIKSHALKNWQLSISSFTLSREWRGKARDEARGESVNGHSRLASGLASPLAAL